MTGQIGDALDLETVLALDDALRDATERMRAVAERRRELGFGN